MAENSSTSSSDAAPHGPRPRRRTGAPWALFGALAMFAGVEAVLHTVPRMNLIAYASDEGQYHAVRDTVEAIGPAEVALVGSSQMREGVSMPQLNAELKKRLGRDVVVSNYAVRGSRLDGMDAVVRFLLRQPKPPRLIIVGVGPRDLRADDIDWPRVALFWRWGDWAQAYRRYGFEATDVLPVMVRNDAGRVLNTLRYREEIRLTLRRVLASVEGLNLDASEEGNPILGEVTYQHTGGRGVRTLTDKTRSDLRGIFARAKEQYLFDQPAKPRRTMQRCLTDLTDELAARPGVGLLVQMPTAQFLKAELDKTGQSKAFVQALRTATDGRVALLPLDAQAFRPGNEHFVDLQHFNKPGAESFGVMLANEIAVRLSDGKVGPATTHTN